MSWKHWNNLCGENYNMQLKPIDDIKGKEEARDIAVEYQNWAGGQSLSYGELAEYQSYFEALAKKFGLVDEFKENGII